MLNDEVMAAIARFFEDGKGPTHDELDRLIARSGLREADPRANGDALVGKMKRVRAVLGHAIDSAPDEGAAFVKRLVGAIRAVGGFRESADQYAGKRNIEALRNAFRHVGYDLDVGGELRPALLENLVGVELSAALMTYVRRARTGAADNDLVLGTAKNLEEATARHVLKERTGSYPVHGNFPTSLGQAYAVLGLSPSTVQLDPDPSRALQQALFLLACAVNRLRNAKGDGHGRPEASATSSLDARLSSQAAGLVAELLLATLSPSK